MKEITIEDIEYVCELARLELSQEEKEHLTPQLKDIIKYVEKLNELNTEKVEPTSHVLPLKNVMRPDKLAQSLDRQDVLEMAPKANDGTFRVPRVIE
jgi:aspartyl-tRNA(Asn)/glutamyl-tRNA(Gln) amidotransferase subunit C